MTNDPKRSSPLSGLRVIELCDDVAGQYCTRLFAGFGADVIRVERLVDASPALPRPASQRLALGVGKRSVALDFARDKATDIVAALVGSADIVVSDEGWAEANREALPPVAGLARREDSVLALLRTFAADGPYATWNANDFALAALSGWTITQGTPGQPPVFVGGTPISHLTGEFAAFGAMCAVRHAEATGHGQTVEVNAFEVAATCMLYDHVGFAYTGKVRERQGNVLGAPWLALPVADGYVGISHIMEWDEFWTILLESDDVPVQPGWTASWEERLELTRQLHQRIAHIPKRHFFETAQLLRLICAEILEPQEVLTSPQYLARDYFDTVTANGGQLLVYPGAPARMPQSPWRNGLRAPEVGEQTEAILHELEVSQRTEVSK